MIRLLLTIIIAVMPFTEIMADTCEPTPHRTTGTHYEPVTVSKTNVGKGVTIIGKILAAPNCDPVSDAKIAHWQADENGQYVDKLRAFLYSDKDGNYEFDTEWPDLSIPHIHFIVTKDGYDVLETQWVGTERTKRIEFNMVLKKSSN